jgi:type IV secretion system T-DNA border endonuclease VirD2
MAFEDELWGALKPMFKPRTSGDPNMKFAAQVRNGTGRFALSYNTVSRSGDPRETLARVVRRCPEVVVKVTGRKKGAAHLSAHLDYIGRHGKLEIETRDGEKISDKADTASIAKEWSDPLYWRKGATVSAVAMIFSMPEGTDGETVKQAVRETADRIVGDNHDYLMALHTDTPRPHVHLTVEAQGIDGRRFDPRREDLFRFREAFAEALRSRGVEAEATPRYTRGQGRAGTSLALTQLRAKIRNGVSQRPTEADIRQARQAIAVALGKAEQPAFVAKAKERWNSIRQSFQNSADILDRTGVVSDRTLAKDVRAFLHERQTLVTRPAQALAEAIRQIKVAREQETKIDLPSRPPPIRRRQSFLHKLTMDGVTNCYHSYTGRARQCQRLAGSRPPGLKRQIEECCRSRPRQA